MQRRPADTHDSSDPAASAQPTQFRTFAGTILQGMDVISRDGSHLGKVAKVDGDHIVFIPSSDGASEEYFVPLSLIDGIDANQILLADRGDTSFGLGAEP